MSRILLEEALRSRDGSTVALVPLIQRHAGTLEQIPDERLYTEPEALARSLRNAQQLYGFDAVTLGADGQAAAVACWLAANPPLQLPEARRAVAARLRLDGRPTPFQVIATPGLSVILEAMRRLRPVLGDRAGIAVVLPDAATLCAQLQAEDAQDWATELLLDTMRLFGPQEPDMFMLLGETHTLDARLEAVAQFFGASLVHVCGPTCPPGVVALPAGLFADAEMSPPPQGATAGTWLYTTDRELDPACGPQRVRNVLAVLRQLSADTRVP